MLRVLFYLCLALVGHCLLFGKSQKTTVAPAVLAQKYVVDQFDNSNFVPFTYIYLNRQKIKINYDTGSSLTWVPQPGTFLQRLVNRVKSTKQKLTASVYTYDPSKSATAKKQRLRPFDVRYADGDLATGVYYVDSAILGFAYSSTGIDSGRLASLPFGVASVTGSVYGIIGLSPRTTSISKKGFLETLQSAGLIEHQVFGFHMNSVKGTGAGQIVFGGVDRNRFSGDLVMLPARKSLDGYLKVTLQEMTTRTFSQRLTTKYNTYIDTGCSEIILPSSLKNQFKLTKDAAGNYVGPCDGSTLGEMTFNFGSISISVPPSYLSRTPEETSSAKTCLFRIDFTGSDFMLGVPFMRAAYVYYDNQTPMMGLAQSVPVSTNGLSYTRATYPGTSTTVTVKGLGKGTAVRPVTTLTAKKA